MIIDAHGHACGEYLNKDSILKSITQNEINKVILFPGELNSSKTYSFRKPKSDVLIIFNKIIRIVTRLTGATKKISDGNRYVWNLKRQMPDKIIQFYWVTKNNIDQIENDYKIMCFSGIKIHQCWRYFKIDSLFFQKIVAFAEKYNLPIVIHLYSGKDAKDLSKLARNSKAKFIIAHCFGIEEFCFNFNEIKNKVYFDISNCYWLTLEKLIFAINEIGCDNLIFGSDTPYGIDSARNTIDIIKKLNICDSDKQKILCENIKKILNIEL